MVQEYKIVYTDSAETMSSLITQYLLDGWELAGNLQVTRVIAGSSFYQPIIRK